MGFENRRRGEVKNPETRLLRITLSEDVWFLLDRLASDRKEEPRDLASKILEQEIPDTIAPNGTMACYTYRDP